MHRKLVCDPPLNPDEEGGKGEDPNVERCSHDFKLLHLGRARVQTP